MKLLRIAFIAIVLITGLSKSTTAQSTPPETSSLLWKIEKAGLPTSYLYGTIHVIGMDQFFFTEEAKEAFNQTEQLALEIDMTNPNMQAEMMQSVAMKDGTTLDQLLTEEEYASLNDLVQQAVGVGLQPFNNWQPILLGSLFTSLLVEGESTSYEAFFLDLATQQEKEVVGLETITESIETIGQMSYKEQAKVLTQSSNLAEGKALFAKMIQVYIQQDIDGLHQLIIQSNGGEELSKFLLDRRNQNWLDDIEQHAAEKATFFAVGSGHLAGEHGLLALLRQQGYTLSPVK